MLQIISRSRSRGSTAGNLVTLLLLVGIIGLGVYLWLGKGTKDQPTAATPSNTTTAVDKGEADAGAPVPIERIIAIGDSLRTDLKGAEAAGIPAIFVASGIHREETMNASSLSAKAEPWLAYSAAASRRPALWIAAAAGVPSGAG